MGTMLTLYLMTPEEVANLADDFDLEALPEPDLSIRGFTSLEAAAIARYLDVPGAKQDPIVWDEAGGLAVFEWHPALVAALAGLEDAVRGNLVRHLQQEMSPADWRDLDFDRAVADLCCVCSSALQSAKFVVEVAVF